MERAPATAVDRLRDGRLSRGGDRPPGRAWRRDRFDVPADIVRVLDNFPDEYEWAADYADPLGAGLAAAPAVMCINAAILSYAPAVRRSRR